MTAVVCTFAHFPLQSSEVK